MFSKLKSIIFQKKKIYIQSPYLIWSDFLNFLQTVIHKKAVAWFYHCWKPVLSNMSTKTLNPLGANPTKWSNTPKQLTNPANCLNVFDNFVGLALKGLTKFNTSLGHSILSMLRWNSLNLGYFVSLFNVKIKQDRNCVQEWQLSPAESRSRDELG